MWPHRLFLLCLTLASACAQTFDAVSVRPSPKPAGPAFSVRMNGGPGTGDPTRATYRNVTAAQLIGRAYGLTSWRVYGPAWIREERYDIDAGVPSGATEDQFRLMLASLLSDRFRLRVHRGAVETQAYRMTIGEKGSKLQPHVAGMLRPSEDPNEIPPPMMSLPTDKKGYPVPFGGAWIAGTGGKFSMRLDEVSLGQLITRLEIQLGAAIVDDTGGDLQGTYDIDLHWVADRRPGTSSPVPGGPHLARAVKEQLGLNLEKKMGPVDMLVIDQMERVPVGN